MENTWITNEFGTREFNHERWTITMFESGETHINTPTNNWQVQIDSNGVSVFGEDRCPYATCGEWVNIPWRIMMEICAMRSGT